MPTMLDVFAEAVRLRLDTTLDMPLPLIASHFNTKYGTDYSAHEIESFTNKSVIKSKHPYLIHALKGQGHGHNNGHGPALKGSEIAKLLDINVQTVYYHQRKYPKKPFFLPAMYWSAGRLQKEWEPEYENWRKAVNLKRAIR